jgi:hypothetical protein
MSSGGLNGWPITTRCAAELPSAIIVGISDDVDDARTTSSRVFAASVANTSCLTWTRSGPDSCTKSAPDAASARSAATVTGRPVSSMSTISWRSERGSVTRTSHPAWANSLAQDTPITPAPTIATNAMSAGSSRSGGSPRRDLRALTTAGYRPPRVPVPAGSAPAWIAFRPGSSRASSSLSGSSPSSLSTKRRPARHASGTCTPAARAPSTCSPCSFRVVGHCSERDRGGALPCGGSGCPARSPRVEHVARPLCTSSIFLTETWRPTHDQPVYSSLSPGRLPLHRPVVCPFRPRHGDVNGSGDLA